MISNSVHAVFELWRKAIILEMQKISSYKYIIDYSRWREKIVPLPFLSSTIF